MAGIYVHIPFCKSRCRYCDFYSTTFGAEGEAYAQSVCREMALRKEFLHGEAVRTLYFGGGTPSQLSPALLGSMVREAERVYGFTSLDELTIEANPDDLSQAWIDGLKKAIPQHKLRISMGIQTFDDERLRLLGRRHTAAEATDAVHRLQESGITEISIDLMYGLPQRAEGKKDRNYRNYRDYKDYRDYCEIWKDDLEKAVRLGVPHISAYHLSYEEGTALTRMRERGDVLEVDEEVSVECFRQLRRTLLAAGYRHYEISNFALPGHEARHNSNYWRGVPYLGLGAGAHSFDGMHRRWNLPDVKRYLEILSPSRLTSPMPADGEELVRLLSDGETLSDEERYDEYIMTRLRTAEGISPEEIGRLFGAGREQQCRARAQTYLKSHRLRETADGRWTLTEDGIFVSDAIIADLFC